jgi:ABC-type spermidine/putrescine transport system permease subunit I
MQQITERSKSKIEKESLEREQILLTASHELKEKNIKAKTSAHHFKWWTDFFSQIKGFWITLIFTTISILWIRYLFFVIMNPENFTKTYSQIIDALTLPESWKTQLIYSLLVICLVLGFAFRFAFRSKYFKVESSLD